MMYNLLTIENRCLAAALYPPDDLQVSEHDHHRLMMQISEGDEWGHNPLLPPIERNRDNARLALRKYLKGDDAKKLQKMLEDPERDSI